MQQMKSQGWQLYCSSNAHEATPLSVNWSDHCVELAHVGAIPDGFRAPLSHQSALLAAMPLQGSTAGFTSDQLWTIFGSKQTEKEGEFEDAKDLAKKHGADLSLLVAHIAYKAAGLRQKATEIDYSKLLALVDAELELQGAQQLLVKPRQKRAQLWRNSIGQHSRFRPRKSGVWKPRRY